MFIRYYFFYLIIPIGKDTIRIDIFQRVKKCSGQKLNPLISLKIPTLLSYLDRQPADTIHLDNLISKSTCSAI